MRREPKVGDLIYFRAPTKFYISGCYLIVNYNYNIIFLDRYFVDFAGRNDTEMPITLFDNFCEVISK